MSAGCLLVIALQHFHCESYSEIQNFFSKHMDKHPSHVSLGCDKLANMHVRNILQGQSSFFIPCLLAQ